MGAPAVADTVFPKGMVAACESAFAAKAACESAFAEKDACESAFAEKAASNFDVLSA